MKDKIEEICNKLNREQLSVYGATNELLILFNVSNSDCKHGFNHVEEMAVVVCTDCKEILGRQSDC
jgi:hypothetical protein